MRKFDLLFLAISLLLSCSYKDDTQIQDVNIIIEGSTYRVDFKSRVYQIYMMSGNRTASFDVSDKDLVRVYNYLNINEFICQNLNYDPFEISGEFPIFNTKVTVKGADFTFQGNYCSPCHYPFDFYKIKKVSGLVELVLGICQNDVKVKNLPNSDYVFE